MAFEEIIDDGIGYAQGNFVRMQRAQGLEVGGGYLMYQRGWSAEMSREGAHASLGEAGQWCDVAGAITVLGKEAHDRFCSMVCSDDKSLRRIRHRILDRHALASPDIAGNEVRGMGAAQSQARLNQRPHGFIDRWLDVNAKYQVGRYECQRRLGVACVVLCAIR